MPDCPSGKIRYPSSRWAIWMARLIRTDTKSSQRPYRCPECGGWHLTSASFSHREMMTEKK